MSREHRRALPGTRTMVLDLSLGTGPASHTQVSRTFARNFQSRTQMLVNQPVNWGPQGTTVSPGPQPFTGVNMDLPLPNYVWPGGTLTWEVVMYSNTLQGTFATLDAGRASMTSPAVATGPGCVFSGASQAAAITSAMADVNGTLCLQVGVARGPASSPVLVAIGSTNWNPPVPGLCGNLLTDLSVVVDAGFTNASGTLASQEGLTLAVPNSAAGLTLYFQAHMPDLGQNGLPLCNSSGVAHTVPIPDLSKVVKVSRMFDNSNTTTATSGVFFAGFSVGYGLPVQFQ